MSAPYEPGTYQHYTALSLRYDGPIPEAEVRAYDEARHRRLAAIEEAAKTGPGSLADKLTLTKRLGLEQRMNRQAAE